MSTSSLCDSVSLESFALFISSKTFPFQDHDRSGCVQVPVTSIWSWWKQGDYVLVALAEPQNVSKLKPRWNGPYEITEVISDWALVIKHLVGKAEKTLYACRPQFYREKDLNVTMPLEEHIQIEEWKITVESFKDFRAEGKEYQVLLRWLWYRRTSAEANGYLVPRCSQGFTTPSWYQCLWTEKMCVTSVSPHTQVVL